MGDSEHGQCELCKTVTNLTRTYFNYNIKCECHSPNHFELVRHCLECTPIEPKETKVTMSTEVLKGMSEYDLPTAVGVLCKALKEDEAYMESWIANITMAFQDEMKKSSIHSPNPDNFSYLVTPEMLHKISNQAAENFINQLIK